MSSTAFLHDKFLVDVVHDVLVPALAQCGGDAEISPALHSSVSTIADLSCVYHTRYNQYHSIVLPLQRWLQERGVRFETKTRIIDMDSIQYRIEIRSRL